MDSQPLRYTKDIDEKIVNAVEDSLKTNVASFEKIEKGEFNHVYKVITDRGNVIIRVFRSGEWPEEDKPMWIEKRLMEPDVPHAKVLFHTRSNTFFPYGFMITEYIEGENGWDAITNGKVTFEEFHKELSKILEKIHNVKVKKFGLLKGGEGEDINFTKSKLIRLQEEWDKAKAIEDLDESLFEKAKNIVQKTLEKLNDKFTPVLIHGDAGPDNCVFTPDGKIILVDWDSSKSSIWFEDYSWMMYWGSHISSYGPRDERMRQIFESSSEITKATDFTREELWELARSLHIIQAMNLLAYYYIDQKNMEAYESTKKRLEGLLLDTHTNIIFNDTKIFHSGLIDNLLLRGYEGIPTTTTNDKKDFELFDRDVQDHPQWVGKYVFFTTVDNNPVGFTSFDPRQKPTAVIGHNAIIPEYKGRGLGKQQMLHALDEIKKQGFTKVIVSTCNNDHFIPAQKMYKACGFKETGTFIKDGSSVEMIGYELSLA